MDIDTVIAVNIWEDDYVLEANERLVTNPAYVGGKFIDGFFYAPQPFPSWTPHEGQWIAPKPMPEDEYSYVWDESAQEWTRLDSIP